MITTTEESESRSGFFNYREDHNESWQFRQDIPRGRDGTSIVVALSEAVDHCKGGLDVLFKKAMDNLWRSTMHADQSVTLFLG